MARKVSVKVGEHTVNGQLDEANEYVHVWISNGPVSGLYSIDRFADSKLTQGSLRKLFTPSA